MWIVNRLILSPQSLVTNSWQWMLQGHTSLWMEEDILLDDLVNPAKSSSRHHRHQIHWTWSWAETRTSTHFSTGTLSHSSTFQDLRRLKLENPIFTSSVQSSMAIGTHTGFITISIFGSSMISVTLKIKTTLEAKFFIYGLKITCRQLSVGGKQTSAQPSKQQSVPCVKKQIKTWKTQKFPTFSLLTKQSVSKVLALQHSDTSDSLEQEVRHGGGQVSVGCLNIILENELLVMSVSWSKSH